MSSAERRAVRSANWRKEHKVKKTHQDVDHRDDYDHDHGDDDHGDDDHEDGDHDLDGIHPKYLRNEYL